MTLETVKERVTSFLFASILIGGWIVCAGLAVAAVFWLSRWIGWLWTGVAVVAACVITVFMVTCVLRFGVDVTLTESDLKDVM